MFNLDPLDVNWNQFAGVSFGISRIAHGDNSSPEYVALSWR